MQAGGRGNAAHWDWNHKRKAAALKADNVAFLALTEEEECHAMMLLLWPKTARFANGELVYVDYLEVAPKDRHGPQVQRDVLGVGAAMIDVAVRVSCAEGLAGRIGLHSLPDAEAFYKKRGLKRGTRDAPENLLYFEMVEGGEALCP